MAGLTFDWLAAVNAQSKKTDWPDGLLQKQQTVAALLENWQAPNRKSEYWRYSDAGRLKKDRLGDEWIAVPEPQKTSVVITLTAQGVEEIAHVPEWLQIKPIQAAEQPQWSALNATPELVVQASNEALFSHGVALTVQSNAPDNASIVLRYAVDEPNQWTYVRNIINLEAGAEITVDEQVVAGRINVNNFYQLADGAHLKRHQHVVLGADQQHVALHHFSLHNATQVTSQNRHEGGDLQHHVHWIDFKGEHAEYRAGSINKASKQSHISDIVVANHLYQNNRSEVIHRSLADDSAQIFNNAKAYVAKDADGSEIEQDLKNILLSEDAKIASKPELEVYADEVVAAHGSTIGTLDEEALFYLQSRGIPADTARQMMMVSFEQEALVC